MRSRALVVSRCSAPVRSVNLTRVFVAHDWEMKNLGNLCRGLDQGQPRSRTHQLLRESPLRKCLAAPASSAQRCCFGRERAAAATTSADPAAASALRSEAASSARVEHWQDRPGPPDVPVAGHDWQGFFVGRSNAVEQYRITPNGPVYAAQFRYLTLAAPWWFLALLFSIAPTRALWRWRRARRHLAPGHCPACGYDLRATPE